MGSDATKAAGVGAGTEAGAGPGAGADAIGREAAIGCVMDDDAGGAGANVAPDDAGGDATVGTS
jgi:hypothetical protein